MASVKNAFGAFGLSPEDATIDTLRVDLALALKGFIEKSQLGQVRAGEVLGLAQNVVSQIVRGRTEHLSVERLIRAMVRAKIPGFAEWGATAEDACARVAVRLDASQFANVAVTPTIGSIYEAGYLTEGASGFSDDAYPHASSTQ